LAIQVLAWDRHKNVAEINQLMRYQSSFSSRLLDHQQRNRYYQTIKTCPDSLPLNKSHIITNMNDNINMYVDIHVYIFK
jgi:hypothetical protein